MLIKVFIFIKNSQTFIFNIANINHLNLRIKIIKDFEIVSFMFIDFKNYFIVKTIVNFTKDRIIKFKHLLAIKTFNHKHFI